MTTSTNTKTVIHILALCQFAGVHPRLLEILLREYGSIENIFQADAGSLMGITGMTAGIANRVADAKSQLPRAEQYYTELKQRDINMVSRFDNAYPQRLFELNDPPTLLFFRGSLPVETAKVAALAGSQRASAEGIELTVELAKRLALAGVQVISSLAHGIDSATHLGSRTGNGNSFSVLQSGLDRIFPEDNQPLAIDIVKNGGLLTEYPPEFEFQTDHYKASNRIVAALAQAVIVTEFYSDSAATVDLLKCCGQIGKLAFVMIDPKYGALTDKDSLNMAVTHGAIPMVGLDKIDDIIQSLV